MDNFQLRRQLKINYDLTHFSLQLILAYNL